MCATTDLLRAAIQHCPLFVSTIMIARWAALAAGPFEEDLRYHEDARYWVTLGLRRTKAIGLRSRLTIRRKSPDGLSENAERGDPVGTIVRLRGLRDLLRDPFGWIHAGPMLTRLLRGSDWSRSGASDDPRVGVAMRAVLAAIDDLSHLRQCDGLSILPLIAGLRHALWRARDGGMPYDTTDGSMIVALARRLDAAALAATPLSKRDIAHWRQPCSTAQVAHRLHVWARFAHDNRDDPRALTALDWFMRRSWRIPHRRGLRRMLAWQRLFGSAWLARSLVLFRFGARRLPGHGMTEPT